MHLILQSTVDSVSVWAWFEIPHGVGNQSISLFSEYFPAFKRRLCLKLQRAADTNTLKLCLSIDHDEAISAVASFFSFSAEAYTPQSSLIPVAKLGNPDVRDVYGIVAPAAIGWSYNLSKFAGPLSTISHRSKFPLDQMVVHYVITKY